MFPLTLSDLNPVLAVSSPLLSAGRSFLSPSVFTKNSISAQSTEERLDLAYKINVRALAIFENLLLYRKFHGLNPLNKMVRISFRLLRILDLLLFNFLDQKKSLQEKIPLLVLKAFRVAITNFHPSFQDFYFQQMQEEEITDLSKAKLQNYLKAVFEQQKQELGQLFFYLLDAAALTAMTVLEFDKSLFLGHKEPSQIKKPAACEELLEKIETSCPLLNIPKEQRAEAIERGLSMPKGILFFGQAGTGKTLLAKYLAKEIAACEDNICAVSASSLKDKFYGQTEKNIRDIFEKARDAFKKYQESSGTYPYFVIILDEADVLLKSRNHLSSEFGAGVDPAAEFLSLLDGVDSPENVLLIATTNNVDKMDSALLREGRFDQQIEIKLPNEEQRKKIFEYYFANSQKYVEGELDYQKYTEKTDGFSPADIAGVFRRANAEAFAAFRQQAEGQGSEQINLLAFTLKHEHVEQAIEDLKAQKAQSYQLGSRFFFR